MAEYLVKYLESSGKTKAVNPNTDVFEFYGIILNGAYFDRFNIAQVSAINDLEVDIVSASGFLNSQDESVSSFLYSEIQSSSGFLYTSIQSVSSYLDSRIDDSNVLIYGLEEAVSGLASDIVYLMSDDPKEYYIVAASGDTTFTVSGLSFSEQHSIPDILVFKNGIKQRQSPNGVSGFGIDFKKIGNNTIQFFYPLVENDRVTIRKERSTINSQQIGFFRDYINNKYGKTVLLSQRYKLGIDALYVWRNGVLCVKSNTLGDPIDRYEETTNSFITMAKPLAPNDVVQAIFTNKEPVYRFYDEGVSSFGLYVPTYTMYDDSFLVFRNGVLLNSAGLGDPIQQYTQIDPNTILFGEILLPEDLVAVEYLGDVQWREDIEVVSGNIVSFTNSYNVGDKKLLVFRDGILMVNSLTLSTPISRYVESASSYITLVESASGEIFTAIYL